MIRNRTSSAAIAMIILAFAQVAAADEADDLFQTLYGNRVKQVLASPDAADDAALATELQAAAQTAADQPKLVALMCRAAWDLSSKREATWEAAGQVVQLWIEKAPSNEAYDKQVELRQRQHTAAKTAAARAEAAPALIDALVAAAQFRSSAKDAPGAAALYRRALGVARTTDPKKAEELQSLIDTQKRTEFVTQRVSDLQTALLENANDSAKAEELVRLMLFDLNDTTKIAGPLSMVKDGEFKKNATLALKPAAELTEDEAFSLGVWSHALAGKTTDAAPKSAMLAKSRTGFERFLALHTAKDLKRTQAELILKQLPAPTATDTTAAAPTDPKDPTKPDKTNLKEGMMGRLTLGGGKETEIVFHYQPGTTFTHGIVEEQVVKLGSEMRGVSVVLTGKVNVPKTITVAIRLAGGSPSGGVTWLHIDDLEVGSVGDDRIKDTTYKRELKAGVHDVRLTITGGHMGGNILEIKDADGVALAIAPDKAALKGLKKPTLVENSGK